MAIVDWVAQTFIFILLVFTLLLHTQKNAGWVLSVVQILRVVLT